MGKKVVRKPKFDGSVDQKCNNCGKITSGGYANSSLFRLWNKYFCSMKCASAKGYTESTNIFYKIHKVIMGIK
jgi:hypothetical protein